MGNWEELKFEELYAIPSRNGLTRPSASRGFGYKFINMGELFAYNRIYDIKTELVKLNDRELLTSVVETGDLLFARQSLVYEGAGKCSIILKVKEPTAFESHLIRVRLNTDIALPMFYYYYFSIPHSPIRVIVQQCAQAGIRGSDLQKLKVPFPDLPTQQKIADILSTYDDLIENNNRRIELLEKSAQELYKEWFVRFRFPDYENAKFVNGLPEGWDYVNFGDVVTVIDGDRGVNYPKQHEFFEEEFCLFLNAGNVTKNGFSFENNSYITEEKDLILRKGKLKKGDIVVTTRGTVGNCAYYTQSVSFEHVRINSGMIILRKNNKLSSGYLYTLLKSTYLKQTIELFSSGSAQPQLPIKDMKHMKILSPSKYVMNTFNDIVEACFDEIALIGTKIKI